MDRFRSRSRSEGMLDLMRYGESNPALTYTITGFLNNPEARSLFRRQLPVRF